MTGRVCVDCRETLGTNTPKDANTCIRCANGPAPAYHGMRAELASQAQVTADLLRCERTSTSARNIRRRDRLGAVIARADFRLARRTEAARKALSYYD